MIMTDSQTVSGYNVKYATAASMKKNSQLFVKLRPSLTKACFRRKLGEAVVTSVRHQLCQNGARSFSNYLLNEKFDESEAVVA